MKPDWVLNEIKYQRALANAKDRDNENEIKELYVSYGGKIINSDVDPLIEDDTILNGWVDFGFYLAGFPTGALVFYLPELWGG